MSKKPPAKPGDNYYVVYKSTKTIYKPKKIFLPKAVDKNKNLVDNISDWKESMNKELKFKSEGITKEE